MFEAIPEFDPHGLKHAGENTRKSSHVNDPYVFQKFPLVLYKGEEETCTVKDDAEFEAAIAQGFSESKG